VHPVIDCCRVLARRPTAEVRIAVPTTDRGLYDAIVLTYCDEGSALGFRDERTGIHPAIVRPRSAVIITEESVLIPSSEIVIADHGPYGKSSICPYPVIDSVVTSIQL
jgi:hypothetical protein